jgi:hypothetical protein
MVLRLLAWATARVRPYVAAAAIFRSARYAHSAVRGANLSEETPPGTAA